MRLVSSSSRNEPPLATDEEKSPRSRTRRKLLVSTHADFIRDPLGRVAFGSRFLIWCDGPALCGAAYWGNQTLEDAWTVFPLIRAIEGHPRMVPPFDVLSDGSRVLDIERPAFQVVEDYVRDRLPELVRRVRRHAIVHPGGYVGSAMAGLYPRFEPQITGKAFENVGDALAWLDRPAAHALASELELLTAESIAAPGLLERLRAFLGHELGASRLAEAAEVLVVSERTLQRALNAAGSTFPRELRRARVQKARELLATSESST